MVFIWSKALLLFYMTKDNNFRLKHFTLKFLILGLMAFFINSPILVIFQFHIH